MYASHSCRWLLRVIEIFGRARHWQELSGDAFKIPAFVHQCTEFTSKNTTHKPCLVLLKSHFVFFYSHSKLFSNFVRLRCSELTHKFPPRPSEWTPWSWTRWGGWSLLPTRTRAGPWTTSQRTTSPWTAPPWTTLVPLHGFSTWGILSWTHPNWSVAIWRWKAKK